MVVSLRQRALIGGLLVGLFASGVPYPVRGESHPGAPVLEALTFKDADNGGLLQVRISGLHAYSCSIPGPASRELVLDLPGATTQLPESVDLRNALVPGATIERGPGDSASVRVKLAMDGAVLSRVEQSQDGLLLHLVRATSPEVTEYHVGVGDKLEINVFGHDDLSKVVEVRADGSINYPLIGDLNVAGRTVDQIDAEVTRILGKDYLVDPQVSVDIREYQSQWVTIIGEVRTPGKYVLKRNMRLIDVLAEAGGATKEAGSQILVTRQGQDGAPRQIVLDRDRLLSQNNQETNIPLQHGDIVAVVEKEVFYIRGEVTKPGAYLLESGMTILKAISLAGGFTQFANRKQVDLLRAGESGVQSKKRVNVKAIEDGKGEDLPVHANDTIIVPRRIF